MPQIPADEPLPHPLPDSLAPLRLPDVTVNVEVYAERNPANLEVVKVTEANLTYVAIDQNGKPRLIPTP